MATIVPVRRRVINVADPPTRCAVTRTIARIGEPLLTQSIDLPGGPLWLLQPSESARLPDDGAIEWAPIAPYWSVLWRSGVALARELGRVDLEARRVTEIGCGLALPSLTAARGGADVLATDADPEALALVARNAELNEVRLETAMIDWKAADELIDRGPFDVVLAADVLYERPSVAALLSLLPPPAPEVWIADPGRPAAEAFLEQARRRWSVATRQSGVVSIHRIDLG
jgi:predicted nicotinamide N-methyase